MLDLLRMACYEGGRLRNVREALLAPDSLQIAAIELQFDALTITISAAGDDDTVLITSEPFSDNLRPSSGALWRLCIGKPLQWAWLMTNQQGYTDGVRLEFNDPDDLESVLVDLVVAASSVHAYQARPIEA